MQESLAALCGGPRGPCNAKTTSSLQPLKKTIVWVKVFINCVQCYGCLELPICFCTPTPTHIHTRTNNPPLHPFPLDRVHGMGSGLGGNEVTRTHPRACKNTLTVKRHPGFCSVLFCSAPAIRAVNPGNISHCPPPSEQTSAHLSKLRIFGPVGCHGDHPDVGLWLAGSGQMKSESGAIRSLRESGGRKRVVVGGRVG